MLICYETFLSIQGESSFAGLPCFFIRLAGCNLNCKYCDTPLASDQKNGYKIDIDELVKMAFASDAHLFEVTGGEPLLQPDTIILLKMLSSQKKSRVLLETNGSIDISKVPENVIIIMDIKTPGSGMSEYTYWKNIEALRPYDEVKFVITDKNDYEWAKQIIKKYKLPSIINHILFSPAYPLLCPSTLAEWLVKDKLNARLQIQLHRYLKMH